MVNMKDDVDKIQISFEEAMATVHEKAKWRLPYWEKNQYRQSQK